LNEPIRDANTVLRGQFVSVSIGFLSPTVIRELRIFVAIAKNTQDALPMKHLRFEQCSVHKYKNSIARN